MGRAIEYRQAPWGGSGIRFQFGGEREGKQGKPHQADFTLVEDPQHVRYEENQ